MTKSDFFFSTFVPILGLYSSSWTFESQFCAFGTQLWNPESRFLALGTQFWTPVSQFLVHSCFLDSISDLLDSILGLGGVNCIDFRTWGYILGLQESTFSWFWGSTVQDWTFESQFWAFWTQVWTSDSRFWAFNTRFWSPGSQFLVKIGVSEIKDYLNTI